MAIGFFSACIIASADSQAWDACWLSSRGALKKAVNPSAVIRSIVPVRSSTTWISGVSVQRESFVRAAGSLFEQVRDQVEAADPAGEEAHHSRRGNELERFGVARHALERLWRELQLESALSFGPLARRGDEVDQLCPSGNSDKTEIEAVSEVIVSRALRFARSALSRRARPRPGR